MIKLECIKRLYEAGYKSFTVGKNYKIISEDDVFIEFSDNKGRELSFSKIPDLRGVGYFHYALKYFNPNPANKRFVLIEKQVNHLILN